MTSTPPRDMAPETTDPLLRLVQTWRQMAEENPSNVDAAGAYFGAADDLRAVMDSFDEPVETVEYRAVGTGPSGLVHESNGAGMREDFDDWSQRPDWTGVRYESRSVRTWVSGWRPVDTGGER